MGSMSGVNNSPIKDHSHKASFAACVAATYSLSVVESDTISCRLDDHETAPPSIKNAYPDTAFLSSAMLPSASAYPTYLYGQKVYRAVDIPVPAVPFYGLVFPFSV